MPVSGRLWTGLVIVLLTAGCLSAGPGIDGTVTPSAGLETPTPTETGTPTPTETATPTPTPVETPFDSQEASKRADPDKRVRLENDWNRSVNFQVRVVRDATDETIYNATHTIDPGADLTAYNIATADPDGVEPFTVVVSARNTTARTTIETNECYGWVYGTITDDGGLRVIAPIC